MSKKLLALALIFAILLSMFSALADVKSIDLTVDNSRQGLGDIPTQLSGILAAGDTLYAIGNANYRYMDNRPRAQYVEVYAFPVKTGELCRYEIEIAPEGATRFISDGERLYALHCVTGRLSPVVFEGEGAFLGEAVQLDWASIAPNSDALCDVYAAVFIGDILYLQTNRTDDMNDWISRVLYRFDLKTGSVEKLFTAKDMAALCAYKDGKLLALRFDQDKYYATAEPDSAAAPSVQVFDPEIKSYAEVLFTVADANIGGLCYSVEADTLYWAAGGSLMSMPVGREPSLLNYLPTSSAYPGLAAVLIGTSHYALNDYNAIYIRSLNLADRPTQALHIAGGQFDWHGRDGLQAFIKKYPGVPVIVAPVDYMTGGFTTAEGIFLDMQTDTAADVYAVHVLDVLQALLNKGYCADLTDNAAITAAVGEMYPHMTAPLYKDGRLYAVPYSASNNLIFCYSPTVLAEMGLTNADLPKTLMEFLAFLERWVDNYSVAHPELQLIENQQFQWRDLLLSLIRNNQVAHCELEGIPVTMDNPEVLALLNKLDAMGAVFAQLDPAEDAYLDWEDSDENALPTALFSLEDPFFSPPYNIQGDYVPLEMAFHSDSPMITQLNLYVLLVNPYSPNREIAVNFLEEMLAGISHSNKLALNPGFNEAALSYLYKLNQAAGTQTLETLQARYDVAEEADKKDILLEIEMQQNWMNHEEGKYDTSPAQIEAYRRMAETIRPSESSYLFINSDSLRSLYIRYLQQQMSAEQYLQETEKVLKKMHSENR